MNELPTIKVKGRSYIFDYRLSELREFANRLWKPKIDTTQDEYNIFNTISLNRTDNECIDFLIKNNVKCNWAEILADYV